MKLLDKIKNILAGDTSDVTKIGKSFEELIDNVESNVLPLLKMHPTQKFETKAAILIGKEILSQPNIRGSNAYGAVVEVYTNLVKDKRKYIEYFNNLAVLNKTTRSMELAGLATLVTALTSTSNALTKIVSLDVAQLKGSKLSNTEKYWLEEIQHRSISPMISLTINAFSYGADKIKTAAENARYIKVVAHSIDNSSSDDSIQANVIPVAGSLFVWFGKHYNTVMVIAYQRDKAYLERIKLDVLLLEESKEGKSDEEVLARIQKQIDYYTNLINKLETKLELTEKASYDN
jgi:hypothetical protein